MLSGRVSPRFEEVSDTRNPPKMLPNGDVYGDGRLKVLFYHCSKLFKWELTNSISL